MMKAFYGNFECFTPLMVGLGAAKLLVSGLYDLPERNYSSIILLDRTHIFSHRMAKFNCVLVKTLANYS